MQCNATTTTRQPQPIFSSPFTCDLFYLFITFDFKHHGALLTLHSIQFMCCVLLCHTNATTTTEQSPTPLSFTGKCSSSSARRKHALVAALATTTAAAIPAAIRQCLVLVRTVTQVGDAKRRNNLPPSPCQTVAKIVTLLLNAKHRLHSSLPSHNNPFTTTGVRSCLNKRGGTVAAPRPLRLLAQPRPGIRLARPRWQIITTLTNVHEQITCLREGFGLTQNIKENHLQHTTLRSPLA